MMAKRAAGYDAKKDPGLKASRLERVLAQELGRTAYADGISAPALDERVMKLLDGEGRVVGQPRTVEIFKAWTRGNTAARLSAPVSG